MFYTYIPLLSENAEFMLNLISKTSIYRNFEVHPCKRSNPCLLSYSFVFSSKDMKDEGLNCICLLGNDDMNHPGLRSLRYEGESRSRCFTGK